MPKKNSTLPPRRPRGRPPLEEKRDLIAMRVLDGELAAFKAAADKADLPYTVWMRNACRRAAGLDK